MTGFAPARLLGVGAGDVREGGSGGVAGAPAGGAVPGATAGHLVVTTEGGCLIDPGGDVVEGDGQARVRPFMKCPTPDLGPREMAPERRREVFLRWCHEAISSTVYPNVMRHGKGGAAGRTAMRGSRLDINPARWAPL
jgi:hypothetical protein